MMTRWKQRPLRDHALMWLSLSALALISSISYATPPRSDVPTELGVPPALEPWIEWVHQQDPTRGCAIRGAQASCVWPTYLSVELTAEGASFLMTGRLDHEGLLPLPHAGSSWPQQVEVRSARDKGWRRSPVSTHAGAPQLKLPKGEHLIQGLLRWDKRPDWIQAPQTVGLTHLRGAGVQERWVERDATGRLWLRAGGERLKSEGAGDSLHIQVFRVFYDEVPLRVETHIQLNTSGQAREVGLRSLELAGSTLVQLKSELTAERRGEELRVYLKPGRANLKLTSLIHTPSDELVVPTIKGAEAPPQEVWVWRHREQLRSVSLSGLDIIDPDQTSLPPELKGGDFTFIATPGDTLKIKELNRGLTRPSTNQLTLERHVWLDLDGEGFVSRDLLSGSLNQGGRLNYRKAGHLGRAYMVREATPLLITQDPQSGEEGVELRSRQIDVQAEVRSTQGGRTLDAVGWSLPVSSLNLTLSLPPGYRLLYAEGVDRSEGAWLESWRMLDFFLILLTVVVFKRLFGTLTAIATLLMMTLYHNVAMAPELTWLLLCATGALIKVIKGKLRGLLYLFATGLMGSLAMMVLWVAHQDLRTALHPQLGEPNEAYLFNHAPRSKMMPYMSYEEEPSNQGRSGRSKKQGKRSLQQLDPNAVVQTGPGLPNWSWRSYQLHITGPVHPERVIALTLITPGWERLLHTARALLILGLFGLLTRWLWRQQRPAQQDGGLKESAHEGVSPALIVPLLSALTLLMTPWSARAEEPVELPIQYQQNIQQNIPQNIQQQAPALPSPPLTSVTPSRPDPTVVPSSGFFPPRALLNELGQRLRAERECTGDCLYLPYFQLTVKGDELTLSAEVHAEQATSFTLPGALQRVRWREVSLGGVALPTRGALRGDELSLVARVPRGQHVITAHATLAPLDSVNIALFDRPYQLSLELDGWRVEGASGAQVGGNIELRRIRPQDHREDRVKERPLARQEQAWYSVTRALIIGLPWQVETTITRPYAGNLSAQALTLPLLEGERLLSPEVSLTDKGARVQLSEGQSTMTFISELNPRERLTLRAPRAERWSETWTLSCGLIWQCDWTGLSPDKVDMGVQGARWSPWPGEEVTLSFTRPTGVKGPASTIQNASLRVETGARLQSVTLELTLKASRGGARELTLPRDAREVRLFVSGVERSDPLKGATLRLPFNPGRTNLKVSWRQPTSSLSTITSPDVRIDGELVNLRLILEKPNGRWLIWTSGPQWGPAVLIYGFLLFCGLLALGLSRSGLSPLSFGAWLLLLLGFTQLQSGIIGVVIWFSAFELRARYADRLHPYLFNLGQLALAFGTLMFLSVIYHAVEVNLLGEVAMQVSGGGSRESVLTWYVDRVEGQLPSASIYTLPLWVWQVLMLLWSLWLANRLLQWVQWAWGLFQQGGVWRSKSSTPSVSQPTAHPSDQTERSEPNEQ